MRVTIKAIRLADATQPGGAAFRSRVAVLLEQLGRHAGRRCALVCDSLEDFAVGFVALAHAGCHIMLPPGSEESIVRACGSDPEVVITNHPEAFRELATLAIPAATSGPILASYALDMTTTVEFFTSGSSGAPTRIARPLAVLHREMLTYEQQWGPDVADTLFVATVPLYHRYGFLFAFLWPLVFGHTLYPAICGTPADLYAALLRQPNCTVISSPAFLSRLWESGARHPEKHLRRVFSAGAPMPGDTARELRQRLGDVLIDIYGTTETGAMAWRRWEKDAQEPAWQAFTGVRFRLQHAATGPRLWVNTPYSNGWVATGDHARFVSAHRFVLTGRVDNVIKLADKRLSLDHMRQQLLQHPHVQDAQLLLLPGARAQLGAVVILTRTGHQRLHEEGTQATRRELRQWLQGRFEAVLVPRKWRFIERWPEHPMSKIRRAALLELFAAQP